MSAGIASIAAYVAFTNTSRTLAHNEKLELNRRKRKHAAVRAALPLALSQICNYAGRSAKALDGLFAHCSGGYLPHSKMGSDVLTALPQEALDTLVQFVEFSDDLDVSLMEDTVAFIQIHNSRVAGLNERNNDPSSTGRISEREIEGRIIDAASIYAGASSYFAYARKLENSVPMSADWKRVLQSLTGMGLYSAHSDEIEKIIDDRKSRSFGPFANLREGL